MRRWTGGAAAAAAAAWLAAAGAQAHSPYLLPNAFDLTRRDHVTVEASFTESFFAPEIVMKSDGWEAIGPDGAHKSLTPTYLKDLALLEAPVAGAGTWRITSGARTGRVAKAALVKGEWTFLDESKPPPLGVTPVDMQSVTRAEVYVSRGAPSTAALAPIGAGLEFHALTHPSEINAGEPARFEALLDGKPLPGLAVELHRADETRRDAKPVALVTDAQGRFAVTAAEPGVYLVMARHRLPPPAAGGLAKSLTYALTFDVGR